MSPIDFTFSFPVNAHVFALPPRGLKPARISHFVKRVTPAPLLTNGIPANELALQNAQSASLASLATQSRSCVFGQPQHQIRLTPICHPSVKVHAGGAWLESPTGARRRSIGGSYRFWLSVVKKCPGRATADYGGIRSIMTADCGCPRADLIVGDQRQQNARQFRTLHSLD